MIALVGAVAAVVAAAVAAIPQEAGGEDHQAVFEIKIEAFDEDLIVIFLFFVFHHFGLHRLGQNRPALPGGWR